MDVEELYGEQKKVRNFRYDVNKFIPVWFLYTLKFLYVFVIKLKFVLIKCGMVSLFRELIKPMCDNC